jgi:hypothetical protein
MIKEIICLKALSWHDLEGTKGVMKNSELKLRGGRIWPSIRMS